MKAKQPAGHRDDAVGSSRGGRQPLHPMQPLIIDEHGTVRFKKNEIVRVLLDTGVLDMNKLAVLNFSREDREQFAQLIGYSVSGFGDLSYVSKESVRIADIRAARLLPKSKRLLPKPKRRA